MEIKLIQNETDCKAALARVSELMDLNLKADSQEANEFKVWVTLIEKYESERYTFDLPTPIEAIKFFMEQNHFNQNDMVSFFGSKAKVSEVLNGKRDLTLSMIRKLISGLRIPVELLIQDKGVELDNDNKDWLAFPLKDMLKKEYFPNFNGKLLQLKDVAEEEITKFFAKVEGSWELARPELRTGAHGENAKKVNDYALLAWQVKVLQQCQLNKVSAYQKGSINLEFMRRIASLSFFDKGPILVKEVLAKHGVHIVVEPHLDQTYLDGAAFLTKSGHPVVALTLRFDRLDSFWFTLLHELAHIAKGHVNIKSPVIFDSNLNPDDTEEKEKEANELTREAFGFKDKELLSVSTHSEVLSLSKKYDLAPSIIIGQVRRIRNDYRLFSKSMGKVRYLFEW